MPKSMYLIKVVPKIFYSLFINTPMFFIFFFITVNISLSTDAKIETHQRLTSNKARPKSLRPFGARLKSLGKPMQHFQSIKRTGKSEQSSISLPIQLGTPGGMKKNQISMYVIRCKNSEVNDRFFKKNSISLL